MTSNERTWKLLPYFLLRSTGFPFDWIERLACSETASALDALLACEEALAACGKEVQASLRAGDQATTLALRQECWRKVARSAPIGLDDQARSALGSALCQLLDRWDSLLACRAEREAQARATFASELPVRRQALRDIASDQSFQEAVWLNSPQMLRFGLQTYVERWSCEHRPSEVRRIERQLISYLQRFCAKNDTASFFGPLNYGDFSAADGPRFSGPGAKHIQRREAFVAYWAVARLAAALANDRHVRPYLRPRRSSLGRLNSGDTYSITIVESSFPLTPRAVQLLEVVDGQRTVIEIASATATPIERVWQELEQLARAHLVVVGMEVPVTELRPLAWLVERVGGLPTDCATRSYWREVLSECQDIQGRFASAALAKRQELLAQLEALITRVTGELPSREGGQFYTDRLPIYEECLGGCTPLVLGPAGAEALRAQLAPVLDLYAAHACVAHQSLQSFGAALLASWSPEGRMPLLQAVARLHREQTVPETPSSPWQQAILTQLARQSQERSVQLDLASLPAIDRSALEANVLFSSPDVMLIARDIAALQAGDFQIVIGECHDTLMVWGWALCFHPQPQAVEAAAADLLCQARGSHQLANMLASQRVKIVPFEFPGPTIEMMASSQKPAADRIPIAEVEVVVEQGRPALRGPGRPRMLLHNGELPTLAHALFAPPRVVPMPLNLGIHTPRVMLGKTVIQREQWRVGRSALFPRRYRGVSFELMLDYRRAARRLGLPRYIFVRVAGERKPVLIDRDNYFLLELLDYLLPEGAEATMSEMLPDPEQLWLRDGAEAFCSELRLSFGYTPAESDDHDRT